MSNGTTGRKPVFSTYNLVLMGILVAIASILFLPPFEIPVAGPYKLDFSNVPIMLGAFAMGPIEGLVMVLLKSLIGLTHTSSAGVGELADFLMGAAFILPASYIYHRKKTQDRAILGMVVGAVLMVIFSVFANLYIMFPFYGIPESQRLGWVLPTIVPFNALKGATIFLITILIYKPLSPLLKGRFGRGRNTKR
jgi:riboflavin transporter FmnP